jgi:hypothetical protein
MTLTEFLLARIAGDEQPDPEALKMDARFSPSQDGFTVENQWARLIHQASGLPVRQRRGSGLARGAPSPARVVADCGSGGGSCEEAGHAREGGGCAELADLATVWAEHPEYRQEWAS